MYDCIVCLCGVYEVVCIVEWLYVVCVVIDLVICICGCVELLCDVVVVEYFDWCVVCGLLLCVVGDCVEYCGGWCGLDLVLVMCIVVDCVLCD